ncbi:fructuronate reductase [Tritrichomonas foetus]|uniref:mannitol 2-dehydrogenase n=1 Tax=Tritrichomonas foetus TaxID=1144522 RepID=A0A1J4J797_9EUKA|nr:fructuronate reductase [Tritrichomonas foetus]|eukprot:OHS94537.1 fructuronate reductase [Tritrichomonas foetus]
MEYYTNLLLEKDPSQNSWGICGLSLLPFDERLFNALQSQQGCYSLTVCGRDGKDEVFAIGSLVDQIYGIKDPEAVINKIADPSIKIISMTITEGGYNIDKETNEFSLSEPKVAADIENKAQHPNTVFGFVAAGLKRRMDNKAGPITILSCDNLQHNGNTCKKAFTSFFKAYDNQLFEWVQSNVTFPNAMVDRITPAVTPADIERLNKANGIDDKAPIYTEDFIQWVIEDNFIAGRPAWEQVGVQFTDDVTAFENMKLSLLNASHQLLSYPSFFGGYRKVDDAMQDKRVVKYLEDFMNIDITPYVPAPPETNLALYKKTLIERFANKSVCDQIARLCFDGAAKIPVYIMPNLCKMINDNKDLKRVTFFAAMYRHYLRNTKDIKGVEYKVNDPWFTDEDWQKIKNDDPVIFLTTTPFQMIKLDAAEKFRVQYLEFCEKLLTTDPLLILDTII